MLGTSLENTFTSRSRNPVNLGWVICYETNKQSKMLQPLPSDGCTFHLRAVRWGVCLTWSTCGLTCKHVVRHSANFEHQSPIGAFGLSWPGWGRRLIVVAMLQASPWCLRDGWMGVSMSWRKTNSEIIAEDCLWDKDFSLLTFYSICYQYLTE